jgi:phosphoribosylformylglycinamidine cyclo-ligase
MSDDQKYHSRGVSADKSEVHEAIKHLSKGLYPSAFCKILPDVVGSDDSYCNIMHADTAGTKTSLAYIYWKETGDLDVWKGVTQDAIVMNIDDMGCVGCISNIVLSSTIGRNKLLIPGDVIKTIINYSQEFTDMMRSHDVDIQLAGGETADVGDIVRTIDIGFTTFSRLKRSDLIINKMQDKDVIVGFSSHGQATYETSYNGGTGSNGLTSARHDVFHHQYREKYPESFSPEMPRELSYSGSKSLTDTLNIDGVGEVKIGQLVLSPTRSYLPLLSKIFKENIPISGIIHCTGGGQTKVLKFISKKKVIKRPSSLRAPLFSLIEAESGTSRKEMYQVFNMGHRLEIYCKEQYASQLMDIASSFNIESAIIGHVEDADENEVAIHDETGSYFYKS